MRIWAVPGGIRFNLDAVFLPRPSASLLHFVGHLLSFRVFPATLPAGRLPQGASWHLASTVSQGAQAHEAVRVSGVFSEGGGLPCAPGGSSWASVSTSKHICISVQVRSKAHCLETHHTLHTPCHLSCSVSCPSVGPVVAPGTWAADDLDKPPLVQVLRSLVLLQPRGVAGSGCLRLCWG